MKNTTSLGVILKLTSVMLFAICNAIVHYLGNDLYFTLPLSALCILSFQCISSLICAYIHQKKIHLTSINVPLAICRVVTILIGTLAWFEPLRISDPMVTLILSTFISRILTLLGATLFLKEKIDKNKFFAFILLLIGCYFVHQSQLSHREFYQKSILSIIYPLIAVLCWSINKIVSRKLICMGESAESLSLHYFLLMAPLSILLLIISEPHSVTSISYVQLAWTLALGVLAYCAHFFMNKAMSYLPVIPLIPLGAMKMIFNTMITMLCFNQWNFSTFLCIGFICIVTSSVLLMETNTMRISNRSIRKSIK